ncbi:MAG: DUF134 domain-containing protein [Candidatus Gracilibacteria bacterium]|nr:DUF134 domain-containing protein [Candidatus Gracilibacteria bacterium]
MIAQRVKRIIKGKVSAGFFEVKNSKKDPVVLSCDEFEAIRIVEKQGMKLQDASSKMGISKSTMHRILKSARGKLADAIVDGRSIKID